MSESNVTELGAGYVIKRLRGETTLGDEVDLIKELATDATCQVLANNVSTTKKWLIKQGANEALFTGSSGLIPQRLLGEKNPFSTNWITKTPRAGDQLLASLLDNRSHEDEHAIFVVDDSMGSGLKARNTLLMLKKRNYINYGFAAIVGPIEYCVDGNMDISEARLNAVEQDSSLINHLFFPERSDGAEWKLMSKLERIADFYDKSELVRKCMDYVLQKIVSLGS